MEPVLPLLLLLLRRFISELHAGRLMRLPGREWALRELESDIRLFGAVWTSFNVRFMGPPQSWPAYGARSC